jgi:hypothetical protein
MSINQPKPNPSTGVMEIAHNLTVGRYDVVMDTGPGYETKRQEGAEAMIDLLKTPLAEPIVKVGADLIVRDMDFPGASDLADRLAPSNPQGMEKIMDGLPEQAKGIVKSMMQQHQADQQTIQQLQLEIKYKTSIEQGWMKTEIQKAHMASEVKAHDVEMRDKTAERDTQVKAHAGILETEISVSGQLLNTHAEAAHNKEAAKIELKSAEKAEKSNGAA